MCFLLTLQTIYNDYIIIAKLKLLIKTFQLKAKLGFVPIPLNKGKLVGYFTICRPVLISLSDVPHYFRCGPDFTEICEWHRLNFIIAKLNWPLAFVIAASTPVVKFAWLVGAYQPAKLGVSCSMSDTGVGSNHSINWPVLYKQTDLLFDHCFAIFHAAFFLLPIQTSASFVILTPTLMAVMGLTTPMGSNPFIQLYHKD